MLDRVPAVARRRRVRKSAVMAESPARNQHPSPSAEAAGAGRSLLLGSEVDVAGSIYIDARVRLEGTIDGEIRCTELEIARQGRVRGGIVAERVVIYGTVAEGSIYANVLVLKPGCSVEAEIFHEHLQLDQGSYFDGKSRRVNDPTALVPD